MQSSHCMQAVGHLLGRIVDCPSGLTLMLERGRDVSCLHGCSTCTWMHVRGEVEGLRPRHTHIAFARSLRSALSCLDILAVVALRRPVLASAQGKIAADAGTFRFYVALAWQ